MITTRLAWGVEELGAAECHRKAIEAGIDRLGGDSTPGIIAGLVEQGALSESRIGQPVRWILRDKFRLGLFENPHVDPEHASKSVGLRPVGPAR